MNAPAGLGGSHTSWRIVARKSLAAGCLLVAVAHGRAETSSNIVGYLDLDRPAGWCFFAQPFIAPSVALADVLPSMPDGTLLYKWVQDGGGWATYSYELVWDGWDPPDVVLGLGEGGFLVLPVPARFSLAGDVPLGGWTRSYRAGFSLFSPPLGHLASAFPAEAGDTLYTYVCGVGGGYRTTTFDPDLNGWDPFVPSFGLDEAGLIQLPTPRVWTTTLTLSEPGAPALRLLPPQRSGNQLTVGWVTPPAVPATSVDLFYTPDLRSTAPWAHLLRSAPGQSQAQWQDWSAPSGFFVLGTLRDTDGDGVTDVSEALVRQSNPRAWDLDPFGDIDGDGIPNHKDARPYEPAVNWPVSISIVKPVNGATIN